MPAPVFGFSVGDFVSVIGERPELQEADYCLLLLLVLVSKISKALKKTGGAASQYQDAVTELNTLGYLLEQLKTLKVDGRNAHRVNTIRGMVCACEASLQDFLKKLDKFEASLGEQAKTAWYRGLPRKTQWAAAFGQEVETLRLLIAGKIVSINAMLAIDLKYTRAQAYVKVGH